MRSRVAAISPIVGGKTIKGPADKMLRGLGLEVSPLGVARLYRDIVGTFVLDNVDAIFEPMSASGCARSRPTRSWPLPSAPPRWLKWFCERLQV